MLKLQLPARRFALLLVVALLNQVFAPTVAWALTSGPTQPEVSSFTPASTSDMVDLFTGNFQYNIPLMDVGGYPINISYSAGPGMDEEASWVGLGWNLNPGVINRQMRGVPDDFKGDSISKTFNIRPDITTGVTVGAGIEIKGLPKNKIGIGVGLNLSRGIYYNTYRGYGQVVGVTPTFSIGNTSKGALTTGLGLSYDSQSGLNLTPSIGLSLNTGKISNSLGASLSINSRRGLRDLSIAYNVSKFYEDLIIDGKNVFGSLGGISTSISFGGSTYTPTSDLPLRNNAFTFHGTLGGEYYAVNPHVSVEGYRTEQRLVSNYQKQSAFGYLNSQIAKPFDVMDFNRERHGLPWREYMPVLPPAFGTFDLFVASGQGCAGQYRAVRNDIGYYKDAFHKNESTSSSLGVELGLGNAVKVGVDGNITVVDAYRQGWTENNALAKAATFTALDGKSLYEPVFFKSAGEPNMTRINEPFRKKYGNGSPSQGELEKTSGALRPAYLISSNQKPVGKETFSSGTNLTRSSREKRNQVWQHLDGREADRYGFESTIKSYEKNTLRVISNYTDCVPDTALSRTRYSKFHISEATIVKPDGSRYVYGIPAYNTHQKDVSFSASENVVEDSTGLMVYDSSVDNSIRNIRGRDNYYNGEIMPPYPYAFLLTAVLSPDYIDRTGNGVSNDDFGSAMRINYTLLDKPFKWRTPYGKSPSEVHSVARLQPGRKSDKKDNKASYIYGEKEVWYVHSIESATMIAQFYLSDRKDALGVVTENGGIDSTSCLLQKLDSIKLFSKAELMALGAAAVPIKTVHFEYDYSLCPNTPNSISAEHGKLTLKRLWFTYGKSKRGELNAYSFTYNDRPVGASQAAKYAYNMAYVDRWGNHKINPSDYPDNSYYPYALQDESLLFDDSPDIPQVHQFAGAWSLSKIELPSGGTIEVEYESDDYAYVQDQRAGQMYFVKGFSKTSSGNIDSLLYHGTSGAADMSRYVWVDLEALHLPSNTLPDTSAFKVRCMESVENIWFHMDVKVSGEIRENITGYMVYDPGYPLGIGNVTDGNLTTVGIPIKLVQTDNNKSINPVTKAALQTMRLELPDLVYPGSEANSGFEAVLKGMVGLAKTIGNIFNGFEINQMKSNKAKYAGVTKGGLKTSWIRLCNPRFKKFGGGHRVKKITLGDNWNSMTGQPSAVYGQQYSYTTQQKVIVGGQEQTLTISSGVASWEPTIGSEENLWKQPVNFNDKIKLAPDNSYYVEKPFGENLFPAPVIGYSEVKVQNLSYTTNTRTGAGWMIHKFYTARDFPVRVDYTAPQRFRDKGHKLKKIFKIMSKDYLHLTQGFTIEVNDMHGKMKQESAYAQNGALISQTSYEYKVDNPNALPLHLNNVVDVVEPDGTIGGVKNLGLDIEIWNDFREEVTLTRGTGLAANIDGFYAFIPIILFTAKAILQKEDVRFRSAVTTKYVKRYGILTKVTKMQDGSTITTENILWDSESGDVLATKTQNEFEDPIYQFTYPAHWVYEGMGMACDNANARLTALYFSNGKPLTNLSGLVYLENYETNFTDGDEFGAIRYPTRWGALHSPIRLTAYNVSGYGLTFYTDDGLPFDSDGARYDLIMLRSGRRNLHATPVGTLVSKTDPRQYSTIQDFSNGVSLANNIVNASANTFRELWQKECACIESVLPIIDTINPYRKGMLGNWRLEDNYVNHRQRKAGSSATNIRIDGTNEGFVPFWDYVSGGWQANPTNDPGWIRQSTATVYDFKGNQVEERDALGIYSMAQFGYQGNLNTAVAHNTSYRQGLFEGFEDSTFNLTPICDFVRECDFKYPLPFKIIGEIPPNSTATISDDQAHTGRYSYKIDNYITAGLDVYLDTLENALILDIPSSDTTVYVKGANACEPTFKPTPGTYLVSAWVYTGDTCNTVVSAPHMVVYQASGTTPFQEIYASGPVIDGWQRIYGKVTVTATSGLFSLRLKNTLNHTVYFDDVRFHPWLGNMKSFVYNPLTLRLMAILDENNYATFYEYDDEGMLIRVKRETERGIMTIEEHRSALKQ